MAFPVTRRAVLEWLFALCLCAATGVFVVREAESRSFSIVVGAAALLILFGLALLWTTRPALAVALVFVALLPLPLSKSVNGVTITVAQATLPALLVMLGLGLLSKPSRARGLLPLAATTTLLLIAGFVSVLGARFQDIAFQEFAMWASAVGLGALLALTFRSEEDLWKAVFILIGGTTLIAFYAVLEWMSQGSIDVIGQFFGFAPLGGIQLRVASTFGYANTLAGYLAVVTPFAVAMIARPGRSTPYRGLAIISLILISVATALTVSRAGLLAEASGLIVAVFLLGRGQRVRNLAVAAGAITAASIIGVVLGVDQTILQRVFVESQVDFTSPTGRINYWRNILSLIQGHELIGVGLGNLVLVNPYRLPGVAVAITHAHSVYFEVLLETGAAGATAGVLFMSALLRTSYLVSLLKSQVGFRLIGAALTASIVAAAVDGIVDWLYFSSQMVNLITVVGAILAAAVLLSPELNDGRKRSVTGSLDARFVDPKLSRAPQPRDARLGATWQS